MCVCVSVFVCVCVCVCVRKVEATSTLNLIKKENEYEVGPVTEVIFPSAPYLRIGNSLLKKIQLTLEQCRG